LSRAPPSDDQRENRFDLRILIVDDDETDRRAVRRHLAGSFPSAALDEARSAAETLDQIASRLYDCVLIDYYLPDTRDLSLVLRIQAAAPELPIIMFTGRGGEDIAVELMKAGVADYIPKASISAERLAAGVRHALALAQATAVHRRAEAQLRDSEARFRRALDIETVGVVFFDTEGAITHANDAFLRMVGFGREDAAAGHVRWDDLTPPEWRPQSLRALEEFKSTGRTTPYEMEYCSKDGGRGWALFAATRLNEREGVEFVIDITRRKRAEDDLRRAMDLAQAATATKSRFLATTSHDLRQPLQLLIRAHEVLDRESLSERGRQALQRAVHGTAHIFRSVDRLAELSKLQSGTITPARRAFQIREVLSEIHQTYGPAAYDKGLEFAVVQLDTWVDSDPEMLTSILENLVGNAIKYTERGGVTISCRPREATMLVEVHDTGLGIPREKVGEIFQEYSRLDPQKAEGLGLGLAIVARQADMLGHVLEVDSTLGVGSCFRIELPLVAQRPAV
jgi:PAS domain S-box-containing protein